ncbi:hypothetical protein T492DRAFT_1118418 [Pavlovales sp. CCMP2436]|nr:hypothetical protein T492DRAFT_1118418 [Pavlovales sp. CCMP2436]
MPSVCPPLGFDSVVNFELLRYVAAPCCRCPYCLHQPPASLFCVRATYYPENQNDFAQGMSVFNEARWGSSTGSPIGVPPSRDGTSSELIAYPDDLLLPENQNTSTAASKLRVGLRTFDFLYRAPDWIPSIPAEIPSLPSTDIPELSSHLPPADQRLRSKKRQPCSLPKDASQAYIPKLRASLAREYSLATDLLTILKKLLFGPLRQRHRARSLATNRPTAYWVVAVSEDYNWAIVSGGPPRVQSNDFCMTGTIDVNDVGFWLLHREPEPPAEVVAEMRAKATELGYDVSVLEKVHQRNCVFTD